MGVTKGVCGDVEIARVFVESGVTALGDARLENLSTLRGAGLDVPLWLLRAPSPRDVPRLVDIADGSLHSDLGVVGRVASESRQRNTVHQVILMVDLDTGREGFHPEEVCTVCTEIARLDGVEMAGLGLYFDFKSPLAELRETLNTFTELARSAGAAFRFLSGGASNVFELVLDGSLPEAVNHVRLGTAPLLGLFSSHGPRSIDDWERDTFVLEAEVIEVKTSRPEAILALGRLDAPMEHLYPCNPGLAVVRSSSDHLVVRFADALAVGDCVRFRLGYGALSRFMATRHARPRGGVLYA